MTDSTEWGTRLAAERGWLHASIVRDASAALLRLEPVDDLLQGALAEATRAAADAHWPDEPSFRAWLMTILRRHLTARRRYWFSIKRDSARVLRLDRNASRSEGGVDPIDTATGPSTFAARRETVETVARALSVLLPLDRELVLLANEGHDLSEVARRTGLSYAAAQRRRLRALERLRRVLTLARPRPGDSIT